jgi:hypothetical protein
VARHDSTTRAASVAPSPSASAIAARGACDEMTRTTVGAFARRQLATSALTPVPRATIESQRGGLVSDGDLQSRRRDRQTVSRSRAAGLASLDSHANPLRDAIRAAALSSASHGAHGPARLALHLLHDDALRTRGQPVVVPGLSHSGPRRADSGSGARCPGEPGVNDPTSPRRARSAIGSRARS